MNYSVACLMLFSDYNSVLCSCAFSVNVLFLFSLCVCVFHFNSLFTIFFPISQQFCFVPFVFFWNWTIFIWGRPKVIAFVTYALNMLYFSIHVETNAKWRDSVGLLLHFRAFVSVTKAKKVHLCHGF